MLTCSNNDIKWTHSIIASFIYACICNQRWAHFKFIARRTSPRAGWCNARVIGSCWLCPGDCSRVSICGLYCDVFWTACNCWSFCIASCYTVLYLDTDKQVLHKQIWNQAMGYFIENPYTPCERFWKSLPQGECKFSNSPTFVNFRLGLSQRE